MYDYKLGIVGAGNMASAILNGILRTGVISPEKIVVSDIDDKKLEIIKNQGVNTVKDNKVLFKNAEFIILAVKPQVAKVIFRDFEKIENLKIISIMAGGLLEIIKENGGIDFIISKLTAHVHGKRGAELSIGLLVSVVDICTANNTVAILTVGGIAKQIGDKYGVDSRKCASILDTFSCCVQGLIPYGAQLLMAAGLAQVNPISITPYLYYPMVIGMGALLAILLRYPKHYS